MYCLCGSTVPLNIPHFKNFAATINFYTHPINDISLSYAHIVRAHFRNFWFVRHFLVEFGMQLFLHNLGTLIPNLPHAKLYFVFYLLKIQKQNGCQN